VAGPGPHRGARVEAQPRVARHLRVVGPARIGQGVGNDQQAVGLLDVWAQKEAAPGASEVSSPTSALPHWRSASMKLMIAIGVSQMAAATATMSSNGCSGGVSRISSW
jgi:hypothetical protein